MERVDVIQVWFKAKSGKIVRHGNIQLANKLRLNLSPQKELETHSSNIFWNYVHGYGLLSFISAYLSRPTDSHGGAIED